MNIIYICEKLLRMKISKLFTFTFITTFFLFSCDNDEYVVPAKYISKGNFDSGVFVLNQGNFTQNASLSFMSFDVNTIKNNILSGISSNPDIGVNATDAAIFGDLFYVVSTSSNKIEILNRFSMEKVGIISSGLIDPKYIAISNGKAFVTNWGGPNSTTDDFVAVIDLSTNLVINSIPVLEGPGRIIANNGKLYVAQTGTVNVGNKVSVIDDTSYAVATINVADRPNTMQFDGGSLWVLCEGDSNAATETTGMLLKINPNTNTFTEQYQFPTGLTIPTNPLSQIIYQHPSNLYISGTDVVYTKGSGVYKMSLIPVITSPNITAAVVYPSAPSFSLPFSKVTNLVVKNSYIYICGYNSNTTNGIVSIFSNGLIADPGLFGTFIKSHNVGYVPSGFYFNQ